VPYSPRPRGKQSRKQGLGTLHRQGLGRSREPPKRRRRVFGVGNARAEQMQDRKGPAFGVEKRAS